MKNKRNQSFKLLALLMGVALLTACGKENPTVSEGMKAIENKEYKQAMDDFARATTAGENDKLIARGMGIAYLGMGEYEKAIESFQNALACSDGFVEKVDYDVNLYLAVAYGKNGQLSQAKEICDHILALSPDRKEALFQRGTILMAQNQVNEAEEDFHHLISLNETDFDMVIRIYEVLEQYGYKIQGREYLQTALDQYSNKMSDYDTGRMYYYLEQYQQAYLALEAAKDKGGAEASLFLGRSYEATGDYDYAIRVYNAFLDKEGENAAIYNQLGLCYMEKQEYQTALDTFAKGMNMTENPYALSMQYNQAVCYEFLLDFEKAKELMGKYLAGASSDEKAQREYAFLQTR